MVKVKVKVKVSVMVKDRIRHSVGVRVRIRIRVSVQVRRTNLRAQRVRHAHWLSILTYYLYVLSILTYEPPCSESTSCTLVSTAGMDEGRLAWCERSLYPRGKIVLG